MLDETKYAYTLVNTPVHKPWSVYIDQHSDILRTQMRPKVYGLFIMKPAEPEDFKQNSRLLKLTWVI